MSEKLGLLGKKWVTENDHIKDYANLTCTGTVNGKVRFGSINNDSYLYVTDNIYDYADQDEINSMINSKPSITVSNANDGVFVGFPGITPSKVFRATDLIWGG